MPIRVLEPGWVHDRSGGVPDGAVEIGRVGSGDEMIYVGRAWLIGDLLPGKVVPSYSCCFIGWDNKEKGETDYEVLVNENNCELTWIPASEGKVPAGAIHGGQVTKTGETLFIGRAKIPDDKKGIHGGKIWPSKGCLFVPFAGKEVECKEYEVLCKVYEFA